MNETRFQFGPPSRVPLWIGAIFIALLVASGTLPIIRALSPSYAHPPVDRGTLGQGIDTRGSRDAHPQAGQPEVPVAGAMIARRNGVWCDECGVVASMRQLARSGDSGTIVAGLARNAADGTSGQAMPSDSATKVGYEFTVRFRDGSALVVNETTPRTWRPGSRVIVIGRTHASDAR